MDFSLFQGEPRRRPSEIMDDIKRLRQLPGTPINKHLLGIYHLEMMSCICGLQRETNELNNHVTKMCTIVTKIAPSIELNPNVTCHNPLEHILERATALSKDELDFTYLPELVEMLDKVVFISLDARYVDDDGYKHVLDVGVCRNHVETLEKKREGL